MSDFDLAVFKRAHKNDYSTYFIRILRRTGQKLSFMTVLSFFRFLYLKRFHYVIPPVTKESF